jgi:hypothetical protein
MPKASSIAERVADKLTAITTAAEALFKHTNKAISIRNKVDRTTEMTKVALKKVSRYRISSAHLESSQFHEPRRSREC